MSYSVPCVVDQRIPKLHLETLFDIGQIFEPVRSWIWLCIPSNIRRRFYAAVSEESKFLVMLIDKFMDEIVVRSRKTSIGGAEACPLDNGSGAVYDALDNHFHTGRWNKRQTKHRKEGEETHYAHTRQ